MSDFWTKALGGAVTAPPAPAPVQQTTAWWDVPRPTSNPQPESLPEQQPSMPQPYYPQAVPEEGVPLKAKSARSTARCPDCGSGNFFKPDGNPSAMEQCYHCGWNPRFAHSTAGAGMPSDKSAPVRPAKQVSTANNFNPQTIIGHIE